MSNATNPIEGLRRPALLVRAARAGTPDYNRTRDLPRILPGRQACAPAQAVEDLLQMEEDLEQARLGTAADYSIMRHIDVLIALMVEARALVRPNPVT